jgi:hypothetical protein
MVNKIKELISNLKEELKAYTIMLNFSKDKSIALKDKNLDSVSKFTSEEEVILKEILFYEKKRISLIKEILNDNDIEVDIKNFNITKISSLIDDEDLKNDLLKTKKELQTTLEDLKKVNSTNEQMIKDMLDIINYSFKVISNAAGQAAGYSKNKATGKDDKKGSSLSQQSLIIDKKI